MCKRAGQEIKELHQKLYEAQTAEAETRTVNLQLRSAQRQNTKKIYSAEQKAIAGLVGRSHVELMGWLVSRIYSWLVGWLVGWSVAWLVAWLVGRLLGWLVGCLVGWSVA